MTEAFQPIAVQAPMRSPVLFKLRCLVDPQLWTIYRFLSDKLPHCHGTLLDVGAGQSPWRELLPVDAAYTGLDIQSASEFGMARQADVIYYPGGPLPFSDCGFDNVLCVEVLEHVPNPGEFVAQLYRVLKPGGTLVLTIPWSARLHHKPHDYQRFSRFGLSVLLGQAGFGEVVIKERGNDIAAIANKLTVLIIRLLRPERLAWLAATALLALALLPVAVLFLLASNLSIRCGVGSLDDPLGYAVAAVKPG